MLLLVVQIERLPEALEMRKCNQSARVDWKEAIWNCQRLQGIYDMMDEVCSSYLQGLPTERFEVNGFKLYWRFFLSLVFS